MTQGTVTNLPLCCCGHCPCPPFSGGSLAGKCHPVTRGCPRWETIFHSGPGNAIRRVHEQHGLNPSPGTKFRDKVEEGVRYMMKNGSQWDLPTKGAGKGVNFPSFDSPLNLTPSLRERKTKSICWAFTPYTTSSRPPASECQAAQCALPFLQQRTQSSSAISRTSSCSAFLSLFCP